MDVFEFFSRHEESSYQNIPFVFPRILRDRVTGNIWIFRRSRRIFVGIFSWRNHFLFFIRHSRLPTFHTLHFIVFITNLKNFRQRLKDKWRSSLASVSASMYTDARCARIACLLVLGASRKCTKLHKIRTITRTPQRVLYLCKNLGFFETRKIWSRLDEISRLTVSVSDLLKNCVSSRSRLVSETRPRRDRDNLESREALPKI